MLPGGIGPLEIALIALAVLLLFGKRLPSVMRSLGKGMVEFKRGVSGLEDEIEEAARKPRELPTKNDTQEQEGTRDVSRDYDG